MLLDRVEALLITPPERESDAGAEEDIEGVLQDLDAVTESPEEATTAATPAEEASSDKDPASELIRRTGLEPDEIDAIARAVIERLSTDTIRSIAWEVVPDVAERLIRERIRQLEQDVDE